VFVVLVDYFVDDSSKIGAQNFCNKFGQKSPRSLNLVRDSLGLLASTTDPTMSPSAIRSSLLPRTILPSIRSYHSPNHPPSPSYTPLQHKILSTALSLVPSTGFTNQTLTDGAKQAGYLEITHNLFPRGPWSLIEYHLVRQRESLSSILLPENAGVGKTIRTLCVERLKGNKDVIGRWQEVYSSSLLVWC